MVGAPEVLYLAQTDALLAFALQIVPSLGICFWIFWMQQVRKGAACLVRDEECPWNCSNCLDLTNVTPA